MFNELQNQIAAGWLWVHEHDLPNWVAFLFSLIVWPITIFLWQRRKISSVPGLEVHFSPGDMTIDGKHFSAVGMRFVNHTGSVVYVSGLHAQRCSKLFPIPLEAARDIAKNSYHLKFMDDGGHFSKREVTIQTNEAQHTGLPVAALMPSAFYGYVRPWYKRLLRQRKYFVLEYTVMVGSTKHAVATRY